MKKQNIIHRNSKKLIVKILRDTSFFKKDMIIEIIKNQDNRWVSDNKYCFFIAHLRNENYIQILKQE